MCLVGHIGNILFRLRHSKKKRVTSVPDLRRKVIGLAAEHRATTVLIEDAGPGMNLLQDLSATMPGGMTRPIGVKPEGSKVDRMAAQSAKIEAGHVYLPKSAAWLGEFLTELLSFPNGRHDDQVDKQRQPLCVIRRSPPRQNCLRRPHRTLQVNGPHRPMNATFFKS
jgi:predicted phage terminase large subunit-like protein